MLWLTNSQNYFNHFSNMTLVCFIIKLHTDHPTRGLHGVCIHLCNRRIQTYVTVYVKTIHMSSKLMLRYGQLPVDTSEILFFTPDGSLMIVEFSYLLYTSQIGCYDDLKATRSFTWIRYAEQFYPVRIPGSSSEVLVAFSHS